MTRAWDANAPEIRFATTLLLEGRGARWVAGELGLGIGTMQRLRQKLLEQGLIPHRRRAGGPNSKPVLEYRPKAPLKLPVAHSEFVAPLTREQLMAGPRGRISWQGP